MLKLENSIRGLSFSRVAFDLTIQDIKKLFSHYAMYPFTVCPVKRVHYYKKRVSMPNFTFLLLKLTVVSHIYRSLLNFMSMMRRTDSSSRASEMVPFSTACVNAS